MVLKAWQDTKAVRDASGWDVVVEGRVCAKCGESVEVFVRCYEIKCGSHGEMVRKVGK